MNDPANTHAPVGVSCAPSTVSASIASRLSAPSGRKE